MSTWNESCDVEEFDGNGPSAIDAGAVVGFTAVGEVVSRAGTFDLEVADGALGVYGGETKTRYISADVRGFGSRQVDSRALREVACLL